MIMSPLSLSLWVIIFILLPKSQFPKTTDAPQKYLLRHFYTESAVKKKLRMTFEVGSHTMLVEEDRKKKFIIFS